jgi:hypothetical protein
MTKQTQLFIVLAMLYGWQAQAQQASFYLKAGVNQANMRITTSDIGRPRKLFSYHAGLLADLPLTTSLWLQPGLFVSGKGTKVRFGTPTDASFHEARSNPIYVELPVQAVLKWAMRDDLRFWVGAGPYAALGIAGTRKASGKFLLVEYERSDRIRFANEVPPVTGQEAAGFGVMRRFDYGIGATVGLEGTKFVFSLGYSLGLTQTRSGTGNDERHRVLGFSIGYRLNNGTGE